MGQGPKKNVLFRGFFKDFIHFIFRQRGSEGGREGEKHQCVAASHAPPTGDLACNPGMCLNLESNLGPFGSQAGAQSTGHSSQGYLVFLIKEK